MRNQVPGIQTPVNLARNMESAERASMPLAPALMARQPIFDPELNVVAYELLYRTEGEDRAIFFDATQATAQVIAGATLDIGFTRLVGTSPAYVNFPASMLSSHLLLPLAPDRIVIEVNAGAIPDPNLLDGLLWLRGEGYRIALDDFDIASSGAELLDYADIVKLDIQRHSSQELVDCVHAARRSRVKLVAEKIETAEELACCRELHFDLFQGFFLQRPVTFKGRRAPTSEMVALDLILSLDEHRASVEEIEKCILRDVGLSYRLLRCINSSYYRTPREVTSIRQAILLLGYQELRKICSVILLTSLSDRPAYLSIQALTRAKMCEILGVMAGYPGSDGYFMTGFMSLVEGFLGAPIKECLSEFPLNESIRNAVLFQLGPMGCALGCVINYERGKWEGLKFDRLTTTEIGSAYALAVDWADNAYAALRSA
ncbi:MAG: HDOD domain-containing protein [Pseudomonadota bacterium]